MDYNVKRKGPLKIRNLNFLRPLTIEFKQLTQFGFSVEEVARQLMEDYTIKQFTLGIGTGKSRDNHIPEGFEFTPPKHIDDEKDL